MATSKRKIQTANKGTGIKSTNTHYAHLLKNSRATGYQVFSTTIESPQ